MRYTVALAMLPATVALAQAAAAPPASQPAPYTLSVTSQLVVVDVTVTDKHGKPVHGLKAGDFVLDENAQPQQVRSFEEHTGLSAEEAARVPAMPKLPPGDFTNFVSTPPNAALDIILIDRLNTSISDQVYLLQNLKKYASQAPPDARIAVFGLTDHLILLKGFTQDPAVFAKAVEFASDPKASHLRDDGLGHGGSEALDANDDFLTEQGGGFAQVAAALTSFEQQYQSYAGQISAKITLDALNTLGRAMVSVPGRKNLIWFSGNFPEQFFPGDSDPLNSLNGANNYQFPFAGLEVEYRETINLLSRSRIAVYPVDAQGLRTSQVNSASQQGFGTVKQQEGRNGLSSNVAEQKEFSADAGEHLAMERIAFDSGGHAFYNNNDLVKATHNAVASGSDFYTLAYAPSDNNPKHLYRNISVKTGDGSDKLGYRRGYYYAGAPDAKQTVASTPAGATPAPPSSMRQAMNLGAPQPTEILLRIHAAPVSGEPEPTVVNGNSPNPDAKKVTGPYRKYQVNFAASARSVAFTHGADNIYHADVDFVTCVYDTRGVLINSQSNTMRTQYDAAKLQAVLRGGMLFDQRISVPEKGFYFLRVIVHDNTNGRVGAIELPVSSVAGLPTLPAEGVPAAGGGR